MNEYKNVETPGHADYVKEVLNGNATPICPTGHEDWFQRLKNEVAVKPKYNNEPWRGKGKRRMPKGGQQ